MSTLNTANGCKHRHDPCNGLMMLMRCRCGAFVMLKVVQMATEQADSCTAISAATAVWQGRIEFNGKWSERGRTHTTMRHGNGKRYGNCVAKQVMVHKTSYHRPAQDRQAEMQECPLSWNKPAR